jgi:hypothetical protein
MNDRSKIILGLAIFIVLVTFPFWSNLGRAVEPPEAKLSEKAKAAKECVMPKDYMKAEHMQVLNLWRTAVVRDGNRIYQSPNGKRYAMSLSSGEDSCIGCHTNKAEFCDKCHTYASVAPYCWDCHIEPKENK